MDAMPRITHRFEFPDRFVAGTVGEPGQRTFFVQARQQNQLVSVVCEKQQVEVLADHLERILDELAKLADGSTAIPASRVVARDLDPLDAPLEEDFRAGTMTIAWDGQLDAVQVELFSVVDAEDLDTPRDPVDFLEELDEVSHAAECLSVTLSPEQAREFTARARALVHAGRPACPFCAQPINPEGHICPRANGYRRPLFA
ncbi:hypothetical protein FM114_07065 [Luteococcus japonicus LSP_Lj1]|uniref:Repeat protein (TIGR03847 family) n=2 Tax=Propionibacteriaceae TaxID=31957 RepID=A0A1R4JF17_9ACTN|nr:hypothetical protein FM114_07065 [Luteococcus japonicus LSP_Lj1]